METINESYLECKFREAWAQCGSNLVLVQELPLNANGNSYRVDFAHLPTAYIIELDGLAYHSSREDQRRDRAKRRDLTEKGWRFLEYTSDDLKDNLRGVISEVHQRLNSAESVPIDAFSTSGRAFSVDDLFQALMAQGFHYRESNILRNPASIDFREAAQSAHTSKQHQPRNTSRTYTASSNYNSSHQQESKKVKLLPVFDGKALSFFLSGFFGPFFGVVFLLVLDLLLFPGSLTAASSTQFAIATLLSPVIGWFLLIQWAKWLLRRGKVRFTYNLLLISILVVLLWNFLPGIIENPRSIFSDFATGIFIIIVIFGSLIGLQRYYATTSQNTF